MTNDLKTTLLGLVAAISGAVVTLIPGAMGELLKTIITAVGAIAFALWGYFTNKGTPS